MTHTQDYRIECGDCLDLLRSIPSGTVRMIWTDPPYGHGNMDGDLQSSRVGVSGARQRAATPIANDKGDDFEPMMVSFFAEAARILTDDCCCCCCMGGGGPNTTFARMAMRLDESLDFFQAVVWDKTARGPGMGWRYRRDYEFVMVSHRKGGRLSWNEGHPASSNIVRDAPPHDRTHPNEKPVSLVRRFILDHTEPGDTVLDPFMGSGTTGVACLQTGRKFIGFEIDPGYCEIARRRLADVAPLFMPPAQEPEPELFQ